MVTEILVKESLSTEMIDAGNKLLRILKEAKYKVTVSFWIYTSDTNNWRLVIATPHVNRDGPKQAYKKVLLALSELPENYSKLLMKDISVLDAKDPLAQRIKSYFREQFGIEGNRLSYLPFGDETLLIEDSYVYNIYNVA